MLHYEFLLPFDFLLIRGLFFRLGKFHLNSLSHDDVRRYIHHFFGHAHLFEAYEAESLEFFFYESKPGVRPLTCMLVLDQTILGNLTEA